MIKTFWASNVPYIIEILDDGLTYFEEKGQHSDMHEKVSIFVSYQQSSGSDFVDDLERVLADKAVIVRDKHLEAWGDLSDFMESIRDQDIAVLVITDGYLKSPACMNEVTQFMRERNWEERVMFAVLDNSIYSREQEYLHHWGERKKDLNEQRKEADISIAELKNITDELEQISKFEAELNDFFHVLFTRKNPKVWMILIEIMNRINKSASKEPGRIQLELLQMSKDMKAKESMSKVAISLLINAAKKRSQIICVQDLSGWFVGVDGDSESRVTDAVQIANLREAIDQLEGLCYIKAENSERNILSVTAEGYRIAHDLEVEQMLN